MRKKRGGGGEGAGKGLFSPGNRSAMSRQSTRYTEHSLRGYDEGSLESSDFGSLTLGGPEEDEDVGLVMLTANNEGIIPAISLFRAKSVTSGGSVASR